MLFYHSAVTLEGLSVSQPCRGLLPSYHLLPRTHNHPPNLLGSYKLWYAGIGRRDLWGVMLFRWEHDRGRAMNCFRGTSRILTRNWTGMELGLGLWSVLTSWGKRMCVFKPPTALLFCYIIPGWLRFVFLTENPAQEKMKIETNNQKAWT